MSASLSTKVTQVRINETKVTQVRMNETRDGTPCPLIAFLIKLTKYSIAHELGKKRYKADFFRHHYLISSIL